MSTLTRRCSLREPHAPHRYSTGEQCNGDSPAPRPRPPATIQYPFPLDGHGRRALLMLPEDLTAREAGRLAAMLDTLPLPAAVRPSGPASGGAV